MKHLLPKLLVFLFFGQADCQQSVILTKAEEQCYRERYTDIKNKDATQHYNQIGVRQGRTYTCAQPITKTQALRFGLSSASLMMGIGSAARDEEAIKTKAAEYFKTIGYSSSLNQKSSLNGVSNPQICADAPEGRCNTCQGTIYLGLNKRPDNGKVISTLEELLLFRNFARQSNKQGILCHESSFSEGPTRLYFNKWTDDKQIFDDDTQKCFCEPNVEDHTYACSDENLNCYCPSGGQILFGRKYDSISGKRHNFNTLKNTGEYSILPVTQKETVACVSSQINGYDPAPGVEKACFCGYQEKDKIPNDIVTSQLEVIKQKKESDQAEKDKQVAQAQADAEKEKARQQIAKAQAELLKAQAEKDKQLKEAAKKEADEKTALEKKLKDDLKAAAAQKKADENRLKELLADQKRLEKEAADAQKKVDATQLKLEKANDQAAQNQINCPSVLQGLGTFKAPDTNQQITVNTDTILLNEGSYKLGKTFDFYKVQDCIWESKKWDKNRGSRWTYNSDGDYWQETSLKGKGPWKNGFLNWSRLKLYDPSKYLGTFKVADANLQITLNPNNVLLNDDALNIAQIDDFRKVGEGIWENPNMHKGKGSRWTYVVEGDYLIEKAIKGKGPWKEGFMKWTRKQEYSPQRYLGTFKVFDANLQLTLNPDSVLLNEDAFKLGKLSEFHKIADGVWESVTWDKNRGSRWTYVPEGDYLRETSLKGKGPWPKGFAKWPRITFYNPEKYLGMFKIADANLRVTLNPDFATLNEDAHALGKNSDFKNIQQGVWENPKWDNNRGSRWTYIPEYDYLKETSLTVPGPWKENSIRWPRVKSYALDKALGTFQSADSQSQITFNPNNIILNPDSLKQGNPSDFKKVDDGVWENPKWLGGRGSRWTYVSEGDYILQTCMTGVGPWPEGSIKWPRIQLYYPNKYLGTFKVADANLQLTVNSDSVLLNENSLKIGKPQDFYKVADGVWESHSWDHNRGSRFTYIPVGDYLIETSLTGNGPWPAGYIKWPRIQIYFPEKYLGNFKVADSNSQITVNPQNILLNEDSLKRGQIEDFKKIAEGIWESSTWDNNRGSRWIYVPEGDYLRETSLKGSGPWPAGFIKWSRQGFYNADKYLGTFKVENSGLKLTLNPESVQLNEDSLKLGSSQNFRKVAEGVWESTSWDHNRGSRWTYVVDGDYLRQTSLTGKGPSPKGWIKWHREIVLSRIQQSDKAKQALILQLEQERQIAIQAAINAAIAKKIADYQSEMNEINAAENTARIQRENKAAIAKAADDKQRADLEARTLAASKSAEAAKQEAFAKEKAAQAEANKANYDKIIAQAYEKMRIAFEAKVVREDANALKNYHDFEIEIKAQAEERERLRQAAIKEKDRAWKAAVKARKLAAENEKKAKEFLIAQEKEKRKIDGLQLQRDLALQKAQQAIKKAEEEFKLAKTEIQKQKAEEAKNRADADFKNAQDAIAKANAKKAQIEADIKEKKELQKQLDFEAEKAEKESKRAQERELSWKKQAADAKNKAQKEIATLDAARKAKAKANKEFRKQSKAKLDKALKSLKKHLAAAKAGADAAHAAQEALRLKRELDQKLDHEKQMSERILEFKSKYPNVWALGKTGLLWAQASLEAKNGLNEDFVKDVILKNIAADCVISKKRFGRNFRNSVHNDAGYFRHKLFCIVSETYADMFMDEMQTKIPLNHASPNIPLDIVFSPIVTGSKGYIEWARKHTNRVDITAANIFSKH